MCLQISKLEVDHDKLAAQVKSLSADIVLRQQEAGVDAWRVRVESLLRSHQTEELLSSSHDSTAAVSDVTDELAAAQRQFAALGDEMRALLVQLAVPDREPAAELRLLVRQHELQQEQDRVAMKIKSLESVHKAYLAHKAAGARALELSSLRAELEKLTEQRATVEQAAALRIAAVHEEKASQYVTMQRMLDEMRKSVPVATQQS